jgi:hypothetical protein
MPESVATAGQSRAFFAASQNPPCLRLRPPPGDTESTVAVVPPSLPFPSAYELPWSAGLSTHDPCSNFVQRTSAKADPPPG